MILSPALIASKPQSGSAPYTPQGVHFDGSQKIVCNSLSSTDTGAVLCSVLLRVPVTGATYSIPWSVDPEVVYMSFLELFNLKLLPELFDNNGGMGHISALLSDEAVSAVATDVWLPILFSGTIANATPKLAIYIGDTPYSTSPSNLIVDGSPGPSTVTQFNGLPFWVGQDSYEGDEYIGDMACLRVWPGQYALDGSGDIPEATRRLFFNADGTGVDPTVANEEFGTPAVWLDADPGDAASFATNRGTGGAFTLTGTLTLAA